MDDDLRVNNQMLRRIKGKSSHQDVLVFEPGSVNKVGSKWDIQDFELSE